MPHENNKALLMYQYNVTVAKSIIGWKINGSARKLHRIEPTKNKPYALNNLISVSLFQLEILFVFPKILCIIFKFSVDEI